MQPFSAPEPPPRTTGRGCPRPAQELTGSLLGLCRKPHGSLPLPVNPEFFFFFKSSHEDMLSDLREKGKEGDREGEKDPSLPPVHTPTTQACALTGN